MADNKIITIIKCQNIAPIENLTREIKSSSLKMGVFANNGSGKTFCMFLQKEFILKFKRVQAFILFH